MSVTQLVFVSEIPQVFCDSFLLGQLFGGNEDSM